MARRTSEQRSCGTYSYRGAVKRQIEEHYVLHVYLSARTTQQLEPYGALSEEHGLQIGL